MTRTTPKFVLDTQLFIDAFRDPTTNEALQRFHRAFAPFEYLSVVVAHELRAGVRRERDRKALEPTSSAYLSDPGGHLRPLPVPGIVRAICSRI